MELANANLGFVLVGDFFQHTFDTSRDGATRKNLHKKGLDNYINQFSGAGIAVDTASLDKTYRCSPTVCDFITKTIGIPIASHRTDETLVTLVENENEALELARDPRKVTLFYENYTKFDCRANNCGRCKGLNVYEDVCVALNPNTFNHLKDGNIDTLPDATRNKFYVACSRARGNLYLMEERLLKKLRKG